MDTHDRTELLSKLKGVDDIPRKSNNLLMGIIVLLVVAVAFLVGWLTADINIILQ